MYELKLASRLLPSVGSAAPAYNKAVHRGGQSVSAMSGAAARPANLNTHNKTHHEQPLQFLPFFDPTVN